MDNEHKEFLEVWLDERYYLAKKDNASSKDITFYNGAVKALYFAGIELFRNDDGEHTIIINK